MRLRTGALSLLAGAGLAFAGCASDNEVDEANRVFVGAPWDGSERLTYSLEQENREVDAACVLTTEPDGEQVLLTRSCESEDGYRDEGRVVAEAETLLPLESSRTVYDIEDDRTTVHAITYGPQQAQFETRASDDDDLRTTTRDLPEPTEEIPEPGWYDDESLLWLVRGIELREGYEDTYAHVINAGQPRLLEADVEVQEREEIEVPAGTFMTHRLRVSSGNVVYRFWVEDGGARRVVKAQVEDSTYELIGVD